MWQFFHRCLAFAQRFIAAIWHFGFFGALKLLVFPRFHSGDYLSHVPIRRMKERPFYFRSKTDLNIFAMFYMENYRIVDVYGPPVKVILDAGANIGDSTFRLRHFHPEAKIYAIEADPDNFAVLDLNFTQDPQVTCLQRALWKEPGTLRIAKTWAAVASRVDVAGQHHKGSDVPAVTVPDLMAEFGLEEIDILKLDIEGAESVIFQTQDQSWLGKVRCIIFECCDYDDTGTTMSIFASLTAACVGFDAHVCGENILLIRRDTPWVMMPDLWLQRRVELPAHVQAKMGVV